jgi:hypothetical protein
MEPATGPWHLLKSKFCTFCSYFFDIFLILYYLNRKHTNFHTIRPKVWPIEIPQFLAPNLKHHPGSELGAFEAEFEPLPTGKPD